MVTVLHSSIGEMIYLNVYWMYLFVVGIRLIAYDLINPLCVIQSSLICHLEGSTIKDTLFIIFIMIMCFSFQTHMGASTFSRS